MALRQRLEDAIHDQGHDEDDVRTTDAGIAPTATLHTLFPAEPRFDALERSVIALARKDRLASLEAPGWVERLVAWMFGLRGDGGRLADARLEALRRAVVVTRHRHHLPDAIAAELRALGYGAGRLRELERMALDG